MLPQFSTRQKKGAAYPDGSATSMVRFRTILIITREPENVSPFTKFSRPLQNAAGCPSQVSYYARVRSFQYCSRLGVRYHPVTLVFRACSIERLAPVTGGIVRRDPPGVKFITIVTSRKLTSIHIPNLVVMNRTDLLGGNRRE
jgi:hypothetical protein